MAEEYKLSLPSAVIINLNIMLGTGIFINSADFAQKAGPFSFSPYLIIGILMIPLIMAMAVLINNQADGSFYGVAKHELGSFWGFISTWSYFIAKPASAGLMIHFCCSLFRQLFPVFTVIPVLALDTIVITLFVILNLLNMRIGRNIQLSFIALKAIPILFIMISGLWLLNPSNFTNIEIPFANIAVMLPLAIYAFTGFEASLSLNRHIKDARRNAPRAIIISYLIVMCTFLLYQLGYYGALNLAQLSGTNSFDGIALFLQSIFVQPHHTLKALLYICMGTSALGGAYSILFSNAWNLHNLAHNNHLNLKKYLTATNAAGIAYWCLFIEAGACFLYLFFTEANPVTLRQINAFGSTLAYTTSMFAFAVMAFATLKKRWAKILAIFALCSCSTFILACVNSFREFGPLALVAFLGLLLLGTLLYMIAKKQVA
jgi:amino acid transporter